jgi:hypothetical protein
MTVPPTLQPLVARVLFPALALTVAALVFIHAAAHWVPAHPGVDQNGYLVGGKLIAETLSMRLAPVQPGSVAAFDPHQFVGGMWVAVDPGTPREAYYPKYPLGLPLLVAVSLWVHETVLAYWISPVATALAVFGTYWLARRFISPFGALLATIVFATSPVTMGLANNPNSHAAAACFVVWGMVLLIAWWRDGGTGRAVLAGLLLGYATTIRYSEAALVGPIVFIVAMRLWSYCSEQTARQAGWLIGSWTIPIAILVTYNLAAMGRITGYDSTNESEGFSLAYAADNWETAIRHLNTNGLSLLLPLSLGGMAWMFRRDWRSATLLALWVVPCVACYTFYYWAPDAAPGQGNSISYLRFFLTILPALAVAAFWMIDRLIDAASSAEQISSGSLATLATGALAALVVSVQLHNAIPLMENDQLERLALKTTSDRLIASAPAESILFCPDTRVLQHLQFAGDYTLYAGNTFTRQHISGLSRFAAPSEDDPQTLDPGRRAALVGRLGSMDQKQLDDAQRRVIQTSLDRETRVFVLVPQRRDGRDEPDRRREPREPREPGGRRAQLLTAPLERVLPEDRFETRVVESWNITVPRTQEANRTRGPRVRGGGPPGGPQADRRTTSFQLIEVLKRPPETRRPTPPPAKPTPATTTTAATTRPAG